MDKMGNEHFSIRTAFFALLKIIKILFIIKNKLMNNCIHYNNYIMNKNVYYNWKNKMCYYICFVNYIINMK